MQTPGTADRAGAGHLTAIRKNIEDTKVRRTGRTRTCKTYERHDRTDDRAAEFSWECDHLESGIDTSGHYRQTISRDTISILYHSAYLRIISKELKFRARCFKVKGSDERRSLEK